MPWIRRQVAGGRGQDQSEEHEEEDEGHGWLDEWMNGWVDNTQIPETRTRRILATTMVVSVEAGMRKTD